MKSYWNPSKSKVQSPHWPMKDMSTSGSLNASAILRPISSPEVPTRVGVRDVAPRVHSSSLPQTTLIGATGVLLVAFANVAAMHGDAWGDILFWSGLVVLFVPFALTLVSPNPSRTERIVLLLEVGLYLYLVKVMRSPVAFTFPDEFIHLRNLNNILADRHLFDINSILPATPYYPGLEIVTSALVNLSGLSTFQAGIVIIGAARLLILLSLYLIFEQLSGSPRVASLGALLYSANSNYPFWTAQFSYESLSLPLAVMVLFLLLRRETATDRRAATGWTVAALLMVFAVIITHHMTAYILIGLLWAWFILERVRGQNIKYGVGSIALIATVATLAWLLLVANVTISYLLPVFQYGIQGLLDVEQGSARQLFRSNTGNIAPLWDRLVGIASVLLLLVFTPIGLARILKSYNRKPLAIVLGLIALAYPLLLPLRLVSSTWEISNRTSEYVFIGASFVVALGLLEQPWVAISKWFARQSTDKAGFQIPAFGYAVIAAILFMGGVVAGWPSTARLAGPYEVAVGSELIYPQGLSAATWMHNALGPENRIAVDYVNARFMLAYGEQHPISSTGRGIPYLLTGKHIDSGIQKTIRDNYIKYTLIDRRVSNNDPLMGLYFPSRNDNAPTEYVDARVYQRFDRAPQVNRLFDSGDIFIYQVEALGDNSPTQ
ncbi:MAG TPA: hypothetical protein VFD70_27635 [Anaerolineae bacterium]|nr:hypothetical protein [Anaerolineae bacterium]